MIFYWQKKIVHNINRYSRIIIAATLLLTHNASAQSAAPTAHRLHIVASFSILADMTKIIAGDTADVGMLVGPDSDAHVFEPSPAAVKRVANADLVIINGLHFEGWIDRLIAASNYRGPVVIATQGIIPLRRNGAPDPHAWQNLRNAKIYVDNIRRALISVAPDNSEKINRRAAEYQAQIDALDAQIRTAINRIPADKRRVITSHDAFEYFAANYGVEFFAPQGWNTDSQASAADVAHIIEDIRALHVRALFVENITDPRLIEQIANEAHVSVGGTLYSDALSPPGTVADSYLKLFAHNVAQLTQAMQP